LYAVETLELTKYYSRGKVKALESCSISVEKGKIFSLLGPNGAGKSTLIKILLGIVFPTKGYAKILDQDISNYKTHSHVGYLAENHRFPDFLTAQQVLYYFGKMSGMDTISLSKRIPELLKTVRLDKWASVKIRKFSKGMLQRLGVAQALINDPTILFLDEPTDGIDPIGRREIRDLLKSLRNMGKTIFLNSHLLSEVERVSDEIAILKDGRLIQKGGVDEFISIKQQYQLQASGGNTTIEGICNRLDIPLQSQNGFMNVSVMDEVQLNHLIDELRKNQTIIQAITPRKITLEDYFIEILESGDNQ